MHAIVNTGPGVLEWQTLPTLEPAAGQVRIRTAACGICATDLQMIAGWERTGFPSIPGHEWSGVVDAVGSETDAHLVGLPCVAENVWADGGEVGFEHPGGYGQFLLTEARNVHVLPVDFPLWVAPLIEPLAVCVRAMRRLGGEKRGAGEARSTGVPPVSRMGVSPMQRQPLEQTPTSQPPVSETATPCVGHGQDARETHGRDARATEAPALILGDGPIGLLMLLLLRRAGAEVALVGGRPARLAIASAMGASDVMNYHDAGDMERLASRNGTFNIVVEASGGPSAMPTAMRSAGRGAKLLVIGDYGQTKADFPWNQLLHQELELIGSNASAGAWPEAIALAVGGDLPLDRLVIHRLPAHDFARAIDLTRTDRSAVKVVIEWPR